MWLVWGAAASPCAAAVPNSLPSTTACEMGSLLLLPVEGRQRLDCPCLLLSAIPVAREGTGQCLAGGLGMSP